MPTPGTVQPRAESQRHSPRRWQALKAAHSSAPRCSTRDAAKFVGVPPTAMQYENRSPTWRSIGCANGSRRFHLTDRRRSCLATPPRQENLPTSASMDARSGDDPSALSARYFAAGHRLRGADHTHQRTSLLAGRHPCRQCRWRNSYDAQRRVVQRRRVRHAADGDPDLERRLRGLLVQAQRRRPGAHRMRRAWPGQQCA